MRRFSPVQFLMIPLLLGGSLFIPASAQIKELTGQWQGNIPFQKKNIPLVIVFAPENGQNKSRFFLFAGKCPDSSVTWYFLIFNKCSTELIPDEIKVSDDGFIFTLEVEKQKATYIGEIRLAEKTIRLRFYDNAVIEQKKEPYWDITKSPVCNDPEALYEEAQAVYHGKDYKSSESALSQCIDTGLYNDKETLLSGVQLSREALSLLGTQNYSDALSKFSRSIGLLSTAFSMNEQNVLALEAKGQVYYQMAAAKSLETVKTVEAHNEKTPVWSRWSKEKLEQEKENGKKEAIEFIDKSIDEYGRLIYYRQFEAAGYIKRARAYYIKWSKYDDDSEYLKKVLKDYKVAIELDPLSFELFYERAQIYQYLGDMENYETDMKRVAELKVNK